MQRLRLLQRQARHPLPPVHAINAGCSGFLQQLQLACHVPHNSRHSRTLLLNIETPEHWHCAADRAFCGLVSAAATATIIDQQRGRPIHWLQTADLPVPDSHLLEPGPLFHTETTDSVTFRGAAQSRHIMRMHGEAVFVHAIELMLHAVKNAWQLLPPSSPVTLIPHQPSGKLLRTFAAALQSELPQIEVLSNLEYSGNTISATIPELLACLPPEFPSRPVKVVDIGNENYTVGIIHRGKTVNGIAAPAPGAAAAAPAAAPSSPVARPIAGTVSRCAFGTVATLAFIPALYAWAMAGVDRASLSVDPTDPQSTHYQKDHAVS